MTLPTALGSPIGIFDSGVGGLSILRHIQEILPGENLMYFADQGYAPYGGKPQEVIIDRAVSIAGFLLDHGAKALVVACNTATVASMKTLREKFPGLTLVGVEPGLKPAASLSFNKKIGVLATERTVGSERYALLRDRHTKASNVEFHGVACHGLADQIELGELNSEKTKSLLLRYLQPLVMQQEVDTIVLGCTHYPFVRSTIEQVISTMTSRPICIVETGDPVARYLKRLLDENQALSNASGPGMVHGYTSGNPKSLEQAFANLLHQTIRVQEIKPQAEDLTAT